MLAVVRIRSIIMPGERRLEDWGQLLGRHWEERARSQSRDFFVASHPGWNNEETARQYAMTELELILVNIDEAQLANMNVLEIGCGPGRLARHLHPRVQTYTGIDIAEGMIEGAQERCKGASNARFFLCDGLSIPSLAQDRKYDLVYAIAVFIHCPKDVILSEG